MADVLDVTILEDGTIKSETAGVSGANHSSAELFLSTVTKLAGGAVSRVKSGHGHVHEHGHDHDHDHA